MQIVPHKIFSNNLFHFSKTYLKGQKYAGQVVSNSFAKKNNNLLKQAGKFLCILCPLIIGTNRYSSDNNISGDTYINNEHITYTNIEPANKDILISTISKFRQNLTASTDFLKDVQISFVDKRNNISSKVNYSEFLQKNCKPNTKGASLYSDSALSKQILILEKAHNEDKLINLFQTGHYTNGHAIKKTLMHEIGHQFDSYFGHCHDAQYAKDWNSLQAKYISNEISDADMKNKDMQRTKVLYNMNNGLSDKFSFQEAVYKDLQYIAELKKQSRKKLARNIRYYTAGINLSCEITPRMVELADFCRGEIYANLFAYAAGEDDGDKIRFTENFSNAYEIVKQDIIKYLNYK